MRTPYSRHMLLPRNLLSHAAARSPRTRLRNAAIAASAAALVLGPLTATASADPAPAPSLPAELIAAVQKDLKISPQEYLRRADLADHVATFTTTAQRQFPQTFAGAWLDQAGKAVVALAPGEGHDEAAKAVKAAGYQVKEVAKSETELRGEKGAFQQWLAGQPKSVAEQVRGAVIDTVSNALAVRVDKSGLPMPGFIDPSRVFVMAKAPTGPQQAELPKAAAVAGRERGADRRGRCLRLGGGQDAADLLVGLQRHRFPRWRGEHHRRSLRPEHPRRRHLQRPRHVRGAAGQSPRHAGRHLREVGARRRGLLDRGDQRRQPESLRRTTWSGFRARRRSRSPAWWIRWSASRSARWARAPATAAAS